MSDVASVVYGEGGVSLAGVRDAARAASAPLVWLRWARCSPAPDALERLLAAEATPAVSLPVDAAGTPLEPYLGRFADDDAEALLAAAARRRVPLRHAYVISLLVEREAVATAPAPDVERYGRYAGSVWTAALFAPRPASLVPASTVRLDSYPPPSLRHALRAASSGAWRRGEAARELAAAVQSPSPLGGAFRA